MSDSDKVFESIGEIKADIIHLKMDLKDNGALSSIKNNLDIIFPDAKCKQVIITENTDKPFFGIVVMPVLKSDQIMDITISDKNFLITEYKVELDSKLFGNFIGLGFDEIESLLIHEVGALVTSDAPAKKVRYAIDLYLSHTGESLKISDYISYIDLLGYGIKYALCKSTSIFYNEYTEASAIDDAYGLTDFIKSALDKIKSCGEIWSTTSVIGSQSVNIIIRWTLMNYRDVLKYRIVADHQLKRGMELTGSKFEQIEMSNLIYRLNRIDDINLLRESVSSFVDKKKKALNAAFDSFKKSGIKGYFDDYYELKMRVNNMDDSRSEAFSILHSLNSRIGVLEDYLTSEEKISVNDAKKIQDLISKYNELRDEISSKKLRSPRTLYIGLDGYYDNE